MEIFYNKEKFNIDLIETILDVQVDLEMERRNKLIKILEKKKKKRYSKENKEKDIKKNLVKYKKRGENNARRNRF